MLFDFVIDDFFKNKARHEPFKYNTNAIMILLVISRLLSPGSKKKAFKEKGRYFERFNFSLADVYRALSHYAKITKEFQQYLHNQIAETNPIVQMGLAMDADGIPLHYELFPGNALDKETFRSVIGQVRRNYDTGRIVVVADMGIITGDNIYYLTGGKNWNGYVLVFLSAAVQRHSRIMC